MKERERLPELLVPAGGREQLESAILYGADAVYMGGPELSLRTACEGFSGEELGLAVADAHTAGVRVYYCLNAMPYDAQLPAVEAVLERLPGMGVDGLIAADPGVIWLAKKHCPSVPLHLSTQAHSVNGAAVAFWREAGVERINLARELGFKQIRALAEAFPGVDFEVFVHGAMCLAPVRALPAVGVRTTAPPTKGGVRSRAVSSTAACPCWWRSKALGRSPVGDPRGRSVQRFLGPAGLVPVAVRGMPG
ncbi:MAG: peptidase U32 family protein [Bilophila wadsworthia]